ncbi:MAG TPA: hypothetical protein VMM56_00140, partial [Planctomycetaceae bacterium]|nr:hypothetical protein [Planctomycetaceae bacterium]
MGRKNSFRIGKVRGDLRGKVWYLSYHENGRRIRPRVGSDQAAAKQLAAQVGTPLNVRDITSPYCQKRKGVRQQPFHYRCEEKNRWEELVEDRHASPADVAIVRIDFR